MDMIYWLLVLGIFVKKYTVDIESIFPLKFAG